MSTTQNTQIKKAVKDQIAAIKAIRTQRLNWQKNAYKTANDGLYEMLGDIFEIYMTVRECRKMTKEMRTQVKKLVGEKKIVIKGKNPDLINMIVKVIFADGELDPKRVSSYIRVLSVAAMTEDVTTRLDFIQFLNDKKGIEQVRRNDKQRPPLSDQVVNAKAGLIDAKTLCTTQDSTAIKENTAALEGSYVVLLGKVNAQGQVEVQHICSEEEYGGLKKSQIGISVVNQALAHAGKINEANKVDEQSSTEQEEQQRAARILGAANDEELMVA